MGLRHTNFNHLLCLSTLAEDFVSVQQTKGDKLQTRVEDLLEQRHKLQKAVDELKVCAPDCNVFFNAVFPCMRCADHLVMSFLVPTCRVRPSHPREHQT